MDGSDLVGVTTRITCAQIYNLPRELLVHKHPRSVVDLHGYGLSLVKALLSVFSMMFYLTHIIYNHY
jgi:hypothetical protein